MKYFTFAFCCLLSFGLIAQDQLIYPSYPGNANNFSLGAFFPSKIEFSQSIDDFDPMVLPTGGISFKHRHIIKEGFNWNAGFSLLIWNQVLNQRSTWIDPNGNTEVYYWKQATYFPVLQLPLSVNKYFKVADRNWLNIELGGSLNWFPFWFGMDEVLIESSTADPNMGGMSYGPNHNSIVTPSGFAAIGFEHMLKSQHMLAFNVFSSYSPFRSLGTIESRVDGNTVYLIEQSQPFIYSGIEMRFGFSTNREKLQVKAIGKNDSVAVADKGKPKLMIGISSGLRFAQQRIIDPNDIHINANAPGFKYQLSVEWMPNKWNYRGVFTYYSFWESSKLANVGFGGLSQSGADPLFMLGADIGKTIYTNKKEWFAIKPWVGISTSTLPAAFFNENLGEGGMAITDAQGEVIYSDSSTSQYPNAMNVYVQTSLELEWRFMKALKFSLQPNFQLGFLEMNRQTINYQTPEISQGVATVSDYGTAWGLQFALKIPIYWEAQPKM